MAALGKRYIELLKKKGFSVFEIKVYKQAARIPRGCTRPYKWIAEKIKKPGASRAVGNALNKNPYPVIIPCHRVIKSDGSIGGFARGRRAKMKLLKSEGIDIIGS